MAWTKSSEGKDKGYAVYSEVLTPSGDNVASKTTSIIDFIPAGVDFTVIANATSASLSASAHIELWAAYSSNAVYGTSVYRIHETPFLSLTGAIDATYKVFNRDVSLKGQYPYYYLKLGIGGDDAEEGGTANATVTMKVIIGKNEA